MNLVIARHMLRNQSTAFVFGLSVAVWVICAALLNAAQPGDNIEQLLWSREFALGYAKHPPVSTWLLIGANAVLGYSAQWTYLLAFLCRLLTLYFIYRIACELLDTDTALWAVLLLTLTHIFTRKAQFYNHNTVLILGLSVLTWMTLLVLKFNRRHHWFLLGLTSGLLVLIKYQSVIGLAVTGVILARWANRSHIKGMFLCMVTAFIVILPHAYWVVGTSGSPSPITYALNHITQPSPEQAVKSILSYAVGFLKEYLVVGLWVLAMITRQRFQYSNYLPEKLPVCAYTKSVIGHLTLTRLAFMLTLGFAGVILQDHWVAPLAMFMSLPLAHLSRNYLGKVNRVHVRWYIFAQTLALCFFIAQHLGYLNNRNTSHVERHLRAESMSRQAENVWKSHTECSRAYLVGDPQLTGIFAAYAPWIKVYGEGLTSPSHPVSSSKTDPSIGEIHLYYRDDLSKDHTSPFDELLSVSAYDDLLGLPRRTIDIFFLYPRADCKIQG